MRAAAALVVVVVLLIAGLLSLGAAPPASPPKAIAPQAAAATIESSPASSWSPGLGGDWPTYLGDSERTAANLLERTLAPSNASQAAVVWSLKTNGSVYSSPAVSNGTAYVGSWDGYEYAITVATGHILWKKYLGVSPTCYVRGTESSATVWNGTVYVGGGNDYWYALSALNGSVEWRIKVTDYGSTTGNFDWASPLLYNGYEYIGLASCSDSPLVQGKILKVNLSGTHSVVDDFDVVPNGQVGGTVWSTSAVDAATGTIWVATGNEGGVGQGYADAILAINSSDMSLIGSWQIPGLVGQDLDFGAGPTLFHDASGRQLVVANDKNGVAYALNRSNVSTAGSWKPVWEAATGDVYAPLAFDGTRLYSGGGPVSIGGENYPTSLLALDPSNGSVVWEAGLVCTEVYGAPVYANGLVIVAGGNDLEIFDASNGTFLGGPVPLSSSETIDGSPAVVNGRIFIGTGDFSNSGHLYELGIPLALNATSLPANQTPDGWLRFHATPAGGAPPYAFSWEFGDGGNGTGDSPVHPFPRAGTYTVNVTATDSAGAMAILAFNVTVASSPQPMTAAIAASPPVGLAPLNVVFLATIYAGGGAPYELNWDFGDGSSPVGGATDWNESHPYPLTGSFLVQFHATDRWGRSANATTVVTVVHALALAVTVTPALGAVPLAVALDAVVSGGASPGPVYWDFGDGSPGTTGLALTHTFADTGNFTISADVRDSLGEEVRQNVTVSAVGGPGGPAPLEGLATTTVVGADCATNTTVVNALGDASGGSAPYSFSWDFGDGSAAVAGPSASHSFQLVGEYVVTLNVTDSADATALDVTSVTIDPWKCPGGTTHPPLASPSTEGWATPTNLAIVAVAIGVIAVAAFLLFRRYRR